MKRLFITLSFIALSIVNVLGQSFTVDGLNYTIIDGTTNVSVAKGSTEPIGALTIPPTVENNDVTYTVTNIRYEAFKRCGGITSVTIPNTVTSIGYMAFYYCYSLDSVNMADGVISLEESSFEDCISLSSIVLSKNLKNIGKKAFAGCSSLDHIEIPYGVTNLGELAFCGPNALKSIVIPNSVTNIGYAVFAFCNSLESVSLPYTIDGPAFIYYFGQYENNDAISINGYYVPKSLKNVTVTGGDIPSEAFNSCKILTSVTISDSVTSIGQSAFNGCSGLTSVIIPNSVKSIEYCTFADCSELTSITIPNTVLSIGNYAFSNCTSIKTINISNSVLSIGQYAFSNCTSLTSVIIPKSVSRIEKAAFYGCALQSITIEKPTPPVLINTDAIQSNIPIYIPCGSLSAYQSANNWGNYIYAEKLMHKLVISSADTEKGNVEITREPDCEKSAVFKATAESGYIFYQWSDGNKSNPRYLIVRQDTALVAYFVVDEVEAEIASANTAQGMVSNSSGTYHYNDEIEISATANYGYTFAKWSDGVTTNPRTVVLKKDTVIRAEFTVNQYTITLKTNIAERGTVSGGGAFNYLSNNKISATANTGYVFANWNDGNTANPRTVALTQDTAFTAVFVPAECALQVSSANAAMGTVSNSSGTYYFNDEVEISATPNYGYHFTCWNDSVTTNPRTVTIKKDTAFTANFAENQYTITVKENIAERGSVSGNGSFNYLTNNKITATPNYGYVFEKWSDGNTDNPRTVALTKDTAFTAVFVQKDFTLSATSANTALGSVTGGGTIKYRETAEITATATAAHHHFVAWSDGNRQNPRTVQVVSDTLFVATFVIDSFTVAATSRTEEFGTVSGSGLYAYGTAVEVKAEPQPHCHFVEWSNGASGLVQQFEVEKDTAFNAAFAIDTHSLRATVADSTMGVATGSGTYDYGTAVTLTATAAAGCYFTGWSDGVTANPRILTIGGDTVVVAQFGRLQEFGITVVPSDEARGTVEGTGRYQSGTEATLSATANEHYYFSQWSDGRTDNPRRVRVIADATYTAVFEPEQYSVTLSQNNADMGMVSGSGQYRYGDMVSCLAKPYQNYHFVQWSNGSTANPYEFVIESNQLLTAYFAAGAVTGIEGDAATEPIIYAVGKTIVVENATDEILVYDAMGKLICRDAIHRVRAEINVNGTGVYVVKIGNVVKRVAVE